MIKNKIMIKKLRYKIYILTNISNSHIISYIILNNKINNDLIHYNL